jgi:hypothetical protein
VMLIGDSHMQQFLPRLDHLVASHPTPLRTIIVRARGGCVPILELPRFGGHMSVLVLDFVFPDFIDLTPQRGLPPPGGRSSGSRPPIAHAPARS